MNRTFRNGILLMAVLTLVGASSAWAVCTSVTSQPVYNGGLGWIANCPDAQQVAGWIYLLSAPGATNSGAQSDAVVCEQAFVDGGIGLPCQPEAGPPGNVTINYEWGPGNPGSVGCPNPSEQGPSGTFPVAVQVVCNNGAGALMQFGYAFELLQYLVEVAFPFDNFINAGFENGPQLQSLTPGAGPSPSADNVCVTLPMPHFYSDCDQGSQGIGGTCTDGGTSRPPIGRGQLYYREAPCGSSPDPRNTAPWTLLPTQPVAPSFSSCNIINRPTTAGMCGFVGATGLLGANQTGGMIGWMQIGGPTASNDKVKIDKAEFNQGKLIVNFSTTNETSIVSFNVYSEATKLNGSPIAATGAGSNPYTFEVGRGALKGGKTVVVEAVKDDGSVEKSAPVTLK